MIISRTPYRISLFGGASDYPQWYREYGGSVLGFAIDKYCYLSVRELPPFFEHKHRIVYSFIELVRKIEEFQHPAVRHILQEFSVEKGLEIHYDGDLPARSGLGSSSSFTVGLIKALYALEGRLVSKRALARQAIHIEQNVIGENVGSQDQVWAPRGRYSKFLVCRKSQCLISLAQTLPNELLNWTQAGSYPARLAPAVGADGSI